MPEEEMVEYPRWYVDALRSRLGVLATALELRERDDNAEVTSDLKHRAYLVRREAACRS